MNTPSTSAEVDPVALLHYATGLPGIIQLESTSADGASEIHQVHTPFALLGRGQECDIKIPDHQVSFRHLYLQPIGRRLACIDLFTALGVEWLDGPIFKGWLHPDHRFRVGGLTFRLLDNHWLAAGDLKAPTEFRPRDEQSIDYGPLATVELELLNTSSKGLRWPINRIITLIGRDKQCRITVADERVSRVHCSLLLLPAGLWAIDLLGKGGIRVDGKAVRCALLMDGQELGIGPYLMTVHYLQPAPVASTEAPVLGQGSIAADIGAPSNNNAAPKLTVPIVASTDAVVTPHEGEASLAQSGTGLPETIVVSESAPPLPDAADLHGEQEFVTRQNQLFVVKVIDDTMVVQPQGDGRAFFYQQVHKEASRVGDVITSRKYTHLVVDLSEAEYLGKLVLDALAIMCRNNNQGKIAYCNASPSTYEELERAGHARIWNHYLSLSDAYLAVHLA